MIQLIVVQLFFIVLNIVEAIHDMWQIEDSKGNKEAQENWHLWSAVYYVLIVTGFSYLVHHALLFPLGLLYRLTVFNNGLNVARGLSFWHTGKRGLDAFFTKALGVHAPKIVFTICILSIIIINLIIKNVEIFYPVTK